MDVPALWIWLSLQHLFAPTLVEDVTVTATRRPVRGLDAPAAVSVLEGDQLSNAPTLVLDDALRATPGFSLFRRSSSRTTNPTAQGVTLRGLSASGAGRTLVLADGLPLNEPFGGWVSWSRLPQASVSRVEVARGALGDLYGPDAAGGVVQVFSREPAGRWRGHALADAGEQDTSRLSVWTGRGAGRVAWTLAAERFDTDGHVPVEPAARGAVDEPAGVEARSGVASVRVRPGGDVAVAARAEVSDEQRANGTALQRNDTNFRQGGVEVSAGVAGGSLRARLARSAQDFDQTFTAVVADRSRETLTSAQRVRATRTTASAEWSGHAAGASWLAGVEGRFSSGRNRDLRYAGGVPAGSTDLGGDHRDVGIFAQSVLPAGRAGVVTAGLRADAWSIDLPAQRRDDTVLRWSPRLSWSRALSTRQVLHASAYAAFRPPTLNELVRDFRVGSVQTVANPALEPESLRGGEAAWHLQAGPSSVRVVAFLTTLDEAIVNVTVAAAPALITRERRNAGRVRSQGLEVESSWRLGSRVTLRGAGTFTDSTFVASAEPALLGRRVPQVARWQGAVSVDATTGAVGGTLAVRASGAQFDDDRNQFALRRAVVADAAAWWRAGERLSLVLALENVTDADYDVGRTPLRTVGAPRSLRAGLRVGW